MAPSVSSTSPVDSATSVSIDSDIEITFSEDVTLTDGWFDIDCTSSGAHTASSSGGSSVYNLDPDSDFSHSEVCTVTVDMALVSDDDVEDPADNMTGDHVFSFTTIGPPVEFEPIVINEIIQNPSAVSDSNGEWFELFNPGSEAVDINGWKIKDDGSDEFVINNGGPLEIPAGGYLVLGANDEFSANGGVTVDYDYPGFFLSNGADELILINLGEVEVDRVEGDGGSEFPDPTSPLPSWTCIFDHSTALILFGCS